MESLKNEVKILKLELKNKTYKDILCDLKPIIIKNQEDLNYYTDGSKYFGMEDSRISKIENAYLKQDYDLIFNSVTELMLIYEKFIIGGETDFENLSNLTENVQMMKKYLKELKPINN